MSTPVRLRGSDNRKRFGSHIEKTLAQSFRHLGRATAERMVGLQFAQSESISRKARIFDIDLVWPGFAEGGEPLEIGSGKQK